MKDKEITFLEKIQLYKKLTSYFQNASKINRSPEEITLIQDIERWGKELRKRANYYDL